jgi:ribonucleotide reductase beta subunit family protein with ferritin-like domain
VNVNLAKRFKEDVPIIEVEMFYDFQMMMENIHAETYSLQLETIVNDVAKRDRLLNALNTIPSIRALTDWMKNCIESHENFAKRLLMMACAEGIFFSGCFCAIYWLQNNGLMPGLGHANELIARDEGLHTRFALHLYNMIEPAHKLSCAQIHSLFGEAVKLAKEFTNDALPEPLAEMNADLMSKYIESVADNLLCMIDVPILYGTKNPFAFMNQINFDNRTNFFERRVSEYAKPKSAENEKEDWTVAKVF